MKRKLWVFFLAVILGLLPIARVAQAGQAKVSEQTDKTKAEIAKRIANGKTKVKLKLHNGVEMEGRLDHASELDFTLIGDKGGQPSTIAYAEVERVRGRGLSSGMKIGNSLRATARASCARVAESTN
jgi:hypothetical protein